MIEGLKIFVNANFCAKGASWVNGYAHRGDISKNIRRYPNDTTLIERAPAGKKG